MYIPAKHNLRIYQRASFEEIFIFKDPVTQAPLDLSGCVVRAEVWDELRRVRYAIFHTELLGAEGKVTIRMSRAETTLLKAPMKAKWDLLVLFPNGRADYLLEGEVFVDIGYTD